MRIYEIHEFLFSQVFCVNFYFLNYYIPNDLLNFLVGLGPIYQHYIYARIYFTKFTGRRMKIVFIISMVQHTARSSLST